MGLGGHRGKVPFLSHHIRCTSSGEQYGCSLNKTTIWPSSLILRHTPGQSSVQISRSVVSDSLWPHGLQHSRLPCPSPTPRACSNSCPSSWWCHPTISSSVVPFSSCLQSTPASRCFPVSMAPSIRIRPSFPNSHSLPSGSFHQPLILMWTEWTSQSQKTNQTDHMGHSLV